MRAVRCWCGELVVADDDDALVRELSVHAADEHADEPRTDAQLREHVGANAEDAPDRPPWAY